jgi:hypothetical protein
MKTAADETARKTGPKLAFSEKKHRDTSALGARKPHWRACVFRAGTAVCIAAPDLGRNRAPVPANLSL